MAIFDPNQVLPDFETQNSQAAQARAFAAALRKKALESQQPEGQMVSGHYVAPHWTQQLQGVLNGINAGWQNKIAGDAETDAANQQSQAAQEWSSAMPQPTAAIPGQGATPFGSRDMPQQDAVQPSPAVPVTREQALKHTIAGLNNPRTRDAALLYNKGFNEDLVREDTQAARRETLTATLEAKREEQKALLEQRAADAKLRSEDQRLSIEQRREAAKEAADARRDVAAIMAAASRDNAAARAEKPKALKPMPATMAGAYNGNETSLKEIDDAIAAVKKNPKAFGLTKIGPNILNETVDPGGVDARAKVARVGSVKRHDISGAAVTLAEDKKLAPWLPEAHQSSETILKKLNNLRAELVYNQQGLEATAESQGYIPMRKGGGGGGTPPAGTTPGTVSWGDLK